MKVTTNTTKQPQQRLARPLRGSSCGAPWTFHGYSPETVGLGIPVVHKVLVKISCLFQETLPKKALLIQNSSVSVYSILKGLLSTAYPSLQRRREVFSACVPRIRLPLGHYCWLHVGLLDKCPGTLLIQISTSS